ncbi:MAG: hypothetical protein A3H98_02975 [Bacteroidetes bacterium RIFCSPLOWO2_02_FULL_36_8]|nr:MAG: hypothetical protein A3H98_02975 [Bacteroidetes bacterium RIFCSPLOWO2_02_FULL_36_8]
MRSLLNIYIYSIFLFNFLRLSLPVHGQFPEFSTTVVEKYTQIADFAYSNRNYFQAIEYYTKIFEKEHNNAKAVNRLAEVYEKLNDYLNAEIWFKISMKLNYKKFPLSEYKYAMMLKRNNKHGNAIKQFEHFIKTYRGEKVIYYQQLAQNEIEGSRFALQCLKDTTMAVNIYNMGAPVNSAYDDFAPANFFDLLVYSSYQSNTRMIVENEQEKIRKIQLFLSLYQDNSWKKPIEFKMGPFHKEGYHASNGSFSSDGSRFYFTFCKENENNTILCDIYVSRNFNDSWSDPVKLDEPINLSGVDNTQPSINYLKENLEVLFFSSNRPWGHGGYDLWYCLVKNGSEYSQVKNLDDMINTTGDEITPFFDQRTQTLFFSSNGHPSIGGFDVFSSLKTGKFWVKSQNLGSPVNSTANDTYYALTDKPGQGYFVSNREGGLLINGSTCCQDIYTFQWKDSSKFIPLAQKQISQPDSSVDMNQNPNESSQIVPWTDIENVIINKTFILKNVYFEFDKSVMLSGSEKDINLLHTFLLEHPDIKVEIGAHTDSKGSTEYNISLSQLRAQTVVNFLVAKGIEKKRLVAKGYGETQPIAANELSDGSDYPEGRQMNRRVEFKIIEKIISDVDSEEVKKE